MIPIKFTVYKKKIQMNTNRIYIWLHINSRYYYEKIEYIK